MSEPKRNGDRKPAESAEGINLGDIYFVLFRRKWIILSFWAAGLAAAALLMLLKPAQYESEAKLLVRYVHDTRLPTSSDPDASTLPVNTGAGGIMDTEVEILTSLDAVRTVVDKVGAARILAAFGGGDDTNVAATVVAHSITTEIPARSTVIHVSFQHPDKQVCQDVLSAIIEAYVMNHARMHMPNGALSDVVMQERDRLREEVRQTDVALKEARRKAGIVSLEDAKRASADFIERIRQDLLTAETDLAEHQAMSGAGLPVVSTTLTNAPAVPPTVLRDFQANRRLLAELMKEEQDDLVKYPETSPFVTAVRNRIIDAELSQQKWTNDYPGLVAYAVAANNAGPVSTAASDLVEEGKVRALIARTNNLHLQLTAALADAARIDDMEAPIQELQRKKELSQENLKHFESSLEMGRIDAELNANNGLGDIGVTQHPSTPIKRRPKTFKKIVMATLAVGIFGGIGFAFLLEMVVDRSIKRPVEVERKTKLPLFISLPDLNGNSTRPALNGGHTPKLLRAADPQTALEVVNLPPEGGIQEFAPWEEHHGLRRFFEGLRDRLIVNFEVRNLTHSPKLVAVTSCHRGAGVSTLAEGLAATLSETGDGNVLLVKMTRERHGAARQFHRGQPDCGLDEALTPETRTGAQRTEKLYVATEAADGDRLPRVLPRRFATLLPKLKASDYDYIIFDMPPVSQTSLTPRLAHFMDMNLLVIEAEKTSQDLVKQATTLLTESRANVGAVLNKTHTYVPSTLHQETLND